MKRIAARRCLIVSSLAVPEHGKQPTSFTRLAPWSLYPALNIKEEPAACRARQMIQLTTLPEMLCRLLVSP